MATIILSRGRCSSFVRLLKRNDVSLAAIGFLDIKVPECVIKRGTRKKAVGNYHIKILQPEDKKRALDFLIRLFFRDEPMAKAVKLLDGVNDRCIELEEYIGTAIADRISLIAVDDNGKLAGVVINSYLHRGHTSKEDIEKIPNPKFKCIIRFMTFLQTECGLWEKVPPDCKKVVDIKIASTDPIWRGRSVMKTMVEETERIAKKGGAGAVHLVATSVFSKRAVERLGYKSIYSVKFAEKPDGPQPETPHLEATVFLKIL